MTAERRLRLARPYLLTMGRTRGDAGDLAIETLIIAIADETDESLDPDERTLLRLAQEPISIAELGAALSLPVGVARVLIADLAANGRVELCDTASIDDTDLVRRLLDGIRAM